ncbi:MAG TPA: type II toxin-antitoxin system PemK/MazF family toxin [Desulfobacterales bacterium]|nr:type II toxin-antitoxin system PemK/MazF family toxin [Desulfobacterales bacterium]
MPRPDIPPGERTTLRTIRWGEVYWYYFGKVEADEHTIKDWHPALILQNDMGNRYSPTTIVTPLTGAEKVKRLLPTHCLIRKADYPKLDKDSVVKLEQIFTIERAALADQFYITRFSKETMREIYRRLVVSLNFGALR